MRCLASSSRIARVLVLAGVGLDRLAHQLVLLALGLVGPGQDGLAGVLFQAFVEGLVQVHGLDQGEVEDGLAAVAAAGRATHLLRAALAHGREDRLHVADQGLVFAENVVEIHGHPLKRRYAPDAGTR